MLGVRAKVVMPEGAPIIKRMAAKGYGADVVLHGRSLTTPAPQRGSCRTRKAPSSFRPLTTNLSLRVRGLSGLR